METESKVEFAMWSQRRTEEYDRRFKHFAKKQNESLSATIENLAVYKTHLDRGGKPKPLAYGFLRGEPSEVVAVDQSGHAKKLPLLRLYTWPCVHNKTLYLLTIGGKDTQSEDINTCKRFVKQISEIIDAEAETESIDDEHETQVKPQAKGEPRQGNEAGR